MNNNIIFYNSFCFNTYRFINYKHTDNTRGIDINYFAYMTEGNARICTENETVNIQCGDIFFIPDGCKYQSYWYGSPKIEFISLGFRFMPNFENKYYAPQVVKSCAEAVKMMQNIASRNILDSETVGEFYTLVGLLMPNMLCHSESKKTELIDKVKRFIALNPSLAVKDIARACAISESALYSNFRKYSDRSINEIKKSVILEKAKEMLIYTDYPIEEISRKLNFSSSVYFRKCFKDNFGLSPRDMRKSFGV